MTKIRDNQVDDDGVNDESHGYADFTTEELLEQAQANAQATIMATAMFLHRKGISLEEWGAYIGSTFALAWDDNRSWEAGEFLDAVLTNLRSFGATVVSAQLGVDDAEAVITGFPNLDLCELFSIGPSLVVRYNEAASTLAGKFGLRCDWRRSGRRVYYSVRRAET